MKKQFTFALIAFIILLGCKENGNQKSPQQDMMDNTKKNVVFILVDDLGWKDLGCYGSTFHETPNIDRLAAQSNLFTNAYTPNPVCSPTRASIMTGKYPSRIGITDWIPGDDPKDRKYLGVEDMNQLPLEEVTIAETLKKADYKTFFAGKWHLGSEGYLPNNQGFDVNIGGNHTGQPFGGYYSPYENPQLPDGPEGEYLTDRLTNESIKFMESNQNDPFLLYLAYYTVHTPIQASKKHLAKFQEKQRKLEDSLAITVPEGKGLTVQNQRNPEYASMLYSLDENVGRLLNKLDELGIADNTLIIFTSDNGGLTTTVQDWTSPTSVKPLRAGKGWAYEGGIRVPLIIKKPKEDKARIIDAPVISMDLFPTILDVLNLEQRPEFHKDGLSLNPLLKNKQNEVHDILFWDYPHYHTSGWTPGQAIRKGEWKLIHFYDNDSYELYNLNEDISEENNLANQNLEKLEELKKELENINQKIGTTLPKLNSK